MLGVGVSLRHMRGATSALAFYAANGLRPTFVLDPSRQKYFVDGSATNLAGAVTHSRASGATYLDSNGVLQTAASGEIRNQAYAYVDGVLTGPYVLTEPDGVNLLHSTNALVTQTEEVTAQPYTLQFTGTGTVTLSGAYSGSLVGTGAGEVSRVYLTFTPTAGTLTITVSGTVTNAQLEAGSIPTSYIPNLAGSGSAARAEDVLTIPDAPWPEAVTTGPELVTNGTFDADTDWTKGTGWTISGGVANHAAGTASSLEQASILTPGTVYQVTVDATASGGTWALQFVGGATTTVGSSLDSGSYSFVGVAGPSNTTLRIFAGSATDLIVDNVSVKEISPRAIGISMKGLMTYADNDIGGNALGNPAELGFYRQKVDISNYINVVLSTGGSATGAVSFVQESNGSLAFVDSSLTAYSPGINVPFSIASYHKDNGINGAVDGVALTEDTTPTILPDLSTTPIAIRASGGPIYLEEMRIWVESAVDKITDTLIEEVSA